MPGGSSNPIKRAALMQSGTLMRLRVPYLMPEVPALTWGIV